MKNEGDKTMKKVLLTSAVALAAFGAVQAVSADSQAQYSNGVVPEANQYKPATPAYNPYHGKPVEFELDRLWIRNINITTGLVSTNTTPQLLKALETHKIEPEKLVTHYFKLSEIEKAYEVFSKAADHHAIKVIIENDISEA